MKLAFLLAAFMLIAAFSVPIFAQDKNIDLGTIYLSDGKISGVIKGDSDANLTTGIVYADETGTGIFYYPECIGECHLVMKVMYDGSKMDPTSIITADSKAAVDWTMSKKTSDSLSITDFRVLLPFNISSTVSTYNLTNVYHSKLSNDTIPSGCTPVNATRYYCSEQNKNGTRAITSIVNKFVSAWKNPVQLKKGEYYYIDYVGYRSPKVGRYSTDFVPSFLGFTFPEYAWWNSSYLNCTSITATGNNTNDTIVRIPVTTAYSANGKDFAILAGNCTNPTGSALPYFRPFYNTSANPVSILYVQAGSTTNDHFALFFNNTESPPDYSNISNVFASNRRADFNNETVGGYPAGWSTEGIVGQNDSYLDDKYYNVSTLTFANYMAFPNSSSSNVKWGFSIRFPRASTAMEAWFGFNTGTENVVGMMSNGSFYCQEGQVTSSVAQRNTDYFVEINQSTGSDISFALNGNQMAGCYGRTLRGSGISAPVKIGFASEYVLIDSIFWYNVSAANIAYSFSGLSGNNPVVVAIQSPTNTTYSTVNITLNYTASSILPIQSCNIEIGNVNTTHVACDNITFLANQGSNTVKVFANNTDNTTSYANISFFVDSLAPTVTIESPTNTNYTSANRTLNFTASDANLRTCTRELNGANTTIASCLNQTFTAAELNNDLKVFVNDTGGNSAVASVSFFLDDIAPQYSNITATPTSPVIRNTTLPLNATYNITVTDNVAVDTVLFRRPAVNLTVPAIRIGNTSVYSVTSLVACGETQYGWDMNDTLGNTNTTEYFNYSVSCGASVPQIFLTAPTGYYNTSSVPLIFTATDDENVNQCWSTIDDIGFINVTGLCFNQSTANVSTTINTTEGNHFLTLYVTDMFGIINYSTTYFGVDLTAPNVTVHSPTGSVTSPFTINITATDVTNITCSYALDAGNATVFACSSTPSILASSGNHTLTIFATDMFNHTSTTFVLFSITTLTPPIVGGNAGILVNLIIVVFVLAMMLIGFLMIASAKGEFKMIVLAFIVMLLGIVFAGVMFAAVN